MYKKILKNTFKRPKYCTSSPFFADPVISVGNFGVEEGYWVKGTREARKSRQLSSNIAAANFLQAAILQCLTSTAKYKYTYIHKCKF